MRCGAPTARLTGYPDMPLPQATPNDRTLAVGVAAPRAPHILSASKANRKTLPL